MLNSQRVYATEVRSHIAFSQEEVKRRCLFFSQKADWSFKHLNSVFTRKPHTEISNSRLSLWTHATFSHCNIWPKQSLHAGIITQYLHMALLIGKQ